MSIPYESKRWELKLKKIVNVSTKTKQKDDVVKKNGSTIWKKTNYNLYGVTQSVCSTWRLYSHTGCQNVSLHACTRRIQCLQHPISAGVSPVRAPDQITAGVKRNVRSGNAIDLQGRIGTHGQSAPRCVLRTSATWTFAPLPPWHKRSWPGDPGVRTLICSNDVLMFAV